MNIDRFAAYVAHVILSYQNDIINLETYNVLLSLSAVTNVNNNIIFSYDSAQRCVNGSSPVVWC